MTGFSLKALEFGVLGLCAITLVLVWRLLQHEQSREGSPRRGILQASYVFMIFSFLLAVLNGYVQLTEQDTPDTVTQELTSLRTELREKEDALLTIRSAANPIINARTNILERMPDGPEKDALIDLLSSLRDVLQ